MDRGYKPLVGDSVTADTPVYIKYEDGTIDIKAICDLFDENGIIGDDNLRDHSIKPYQILTRSGWRHIKYVYKHGTDKKIHNIVTKDRYVNVTEDHSLFQNGVEIKPSELKRGDIIDVIDVPFSEIKSEMSLDKAWLMGFFLGDGSSCNNFRETSRYKSKKTGDFRKYKSRRCDWKISNKDILLLEKAKNILEKEYGIKANIKDHLKSSSVYNLYSAKKELCEWYSNNFYTSYREKKVPMLILNSSIEVKKSFIDGFMSADGDGYTMDTTTSFCQKSQITMAGLSLLFKELDNNYKIVVRKDKENIISFITGCIRNGKNYKINDDKSNIKSNEVWVNRVVKNKTEYVYDVSTEDGTFICGIGGVIAHNTDGMNFSCPDDVESRTYIGKGFHRFSEEGKEYKGIEADVAEYNDRYMFEAMGLDIDEVWPATINISRKNYATLKPNGKIKLTGNTIKGKTIPKYIKTFLDKGIKMLLSGDGKSFVEYYYEYLERIYNMDIPLSEIANKSKVKKTIQQYLNRGTDKNGKDLARQAHMELLIKESAHADLGETVFYVNNGTKKSHGDIQVRKTKNDPPEGTLIFNSYLIRSEEMEKNPNLKGVYNVPKYIDAFNKKVEPLLVVFNIGVRETLLITDPEERQYYTNSELELVSGIPSSPGDQDTLEELLTISDAELDFWNKMGVSPDYMVNDRLSDKVENLDSKSQNLVH